MYCNCEEDENGRVTSLCGAHHQWLHDNVWPDMRAKDAEIERLKEVLKLEAERAQVFGFGRVHKYLLEKIEQ